MPSLNIVVRLGVNTVPVLAVSVVYPLRDLSWLYGKRRQVETDLRHIKITLGMDVLHTRSMDGVCKELTMFVLAYHLVRMAMSEAAHRHRISFVDPLR